MTGAPPRSVLYLPASNPRAIEKARSLDCDQVVLDLEDAVAPDRKAEARAAAAAAVRAGGFPAPPGVRINGLDTEWGRDDLDALTGAGVTLIVAPKVESAAAVRTLARHIPAEAALWAMIETPAALLRLAEIADAGAPLAGLMLGVNDLAAGLQTGGKVVDPQRRPGPGAAEAVAGRDGGGGADGRSGGDRRSLQPAGRSRRPRRRMRPGPALRI